MNVKGGPLDEGLSADGALVVADVVVDVQMLPELLPGFKCLPAQITYEIPYICNKYIT